MTRKQMMRHLQQSVNFSHISASHEGYEPSAPGDASMMHNTLMLSKHARVSHGKLRQALHKKIGSLEFIDRDEPLKNHHVRRAMKGILGDAKTEDERIQRLLEAM